MITDGELAELERSVEEALATGDAGALRVLGRGEISVVLGWPGDDPRWACKRLPPFPDPPVADRYAAVLARYVAALAERGVRVVGTDVRRVTGTGGRPVLYCVQSVLPANTLAVDAARRDPQRAEEIVRRIVDTVLSTVDATVGLDAQLSNWATDGDDLVYFDVTTPMIRRADGTSDLDAGLFLASLPWVLRPAVRRFVVPGILDRYHDPRTVVVDLAANLIKERLEPLIGTVITAADERVVPPLTEAEVRRDYRGDARMWAALQHVRRADRWWHRQIRRRPYPFLLPEEIER